ncbi:carboxypeptidase regulatory-like domain-containing protein, partial [Flavobacteriales bacterium]|nr:carboxypeptidase regulatory-like domain-containing protein [Flavobacteriales bacterium]
SGNQPMVLTSDSMLVVGITFQNVSTCNCVETLFAKFDLDGNIIWMKNINTSDPSQVRIKDIVETADSGFALAFNVDTTGAVYSSFDAAILKTAIDGSIEWSKKLSLSNTDDRIRSLVAQDDGTILGFGYNKKAIFEGSENLFMLKLNAQGDSIFTRAYGGTDADKRPYATQANDSSYFVVYQTISFFKTNTVFSNVPEGMAAMVLDQEGNITNDPSCRFYPEFGFSSINLEISPFSTTESFFNYDEFAGVKKYGIPITPSNPRFIAGKIADYSGIGTNDVTVYIYAVSSEPGAYDTAAVFDSFQPLGFPVPGYDGFYGATVDSGDYIIQAVPDQSVFPNAIPTYFPGTHEWDSAEVVSPTCPIYLNLDFNLADTTSLLELAPISGPGSISGTIQFSEDRAGDPIPGVDISLEQIPGGIIAHTETDEDGIFEFTSVPENDYKIWVDYPGLPMDSTYSFGVSTANMSINQLDYLVDLDSTIFISKVNSINEEIAKQGGLKVFPNPIKEYGTVDLTALDLRNDVRFNVYDLKGRLISQNTYNEGDHIVINRKDFNVGHYVFEVFTEKKQYSGKFIIE